MAGDDHCYLARIQKRGVGLDKVKYPVKHRLKNELIGAVVGFLLFLVLHALYQVHVPVATFVDASVVHRAKGSVTLSVSGYKIHDCKLVGGSFVGWYINQAGEWAEARGPVQFPDDASIDSTRPASIFTRQHFGLLRITGIPPYTVMVRITVNHLCDGDEQPRLTTMGPWRIPVFVREGVSSE